MEFWSAFQAFVLGVVEGLTEFLPVSSTGHQIIVADLLGFVGERAQAFNIIIQLAAILAVVWEFRGKIFEVIRGLPSERRAQRFTVNLLVAFFPAVVLGVAFADLIHHYLFNPITVAAALVVGGVVMLWAEKREHRMTLFGGGQALGTFLVALGKQSTGAKERAGDYRTPEGLYHIDARNPNSRYHLALHVSYPNAADLAHARTLGVSTGGDIMIHGLPNGQGGVGAAHREYDWTNGCVAVTDQEIEQIWNAVPVGTPVRAPASGVVTFAAPALYLTGGTVLIDHGFGLSSNFLHLSALKVHVGERVRQGQVIALSGMTGRATGPHLHWGFNWFGTRLDPLLLPGLRDH